MKKFFTGLVGTLVLASGITFGGGVITAERAEAVTYSNCWRYNDYYINCHANYSWYEESWWGGSHRDGRVLVYSPLIYKTW